MALLLVARTLSAESMPPQRIQWQKVPIAISLSVGEERMVHFRTPISVGIPATLESVLRTQTVNGTVYWMAKAAFGSTRVMVREIEGGQTYLFDLSAATDGEHAAAIVVLVDETTEAEYRLGETGEGARHGYVSLTRYAAQQLYAPMRLLSSVPGIVRVPVQQHSVALVPGNGVAATPLVAWRAGHLYVTAVKLTNRLAKAQILDPRTLRGAWLSAAFQHSRLLPAGSDADTTAVYLVSAQPFAEAL
jgi:integrating conjugative element protein (TIGR03749 family)